ncbi:MAG TPA: serine/threonine-protein kinase, partial [Polyangia bacterium]|nr:serine/threonine-protein kinase [Polyangia bacterium]
MAATAFEPPLSLAPQTTPSKGAPSAVQFGAYRLLHLLGEGGMAEVWRAEWKDAGGAHLPVAFKRILPALAREPEVARMFRDETRLALRLRHANIVRALDAGELDGRPYLALELIEGVDLRTVLRASPTPLPLGFALHVARALAAALAYAHRLRDGHGRWLGIVHRDVSPSNVMIGRDGVVKLLDFGVAKAVARDAATRFGVLRGKLGYMAPEFIAGAPYDNRADQFALGVVMWELLANRRLYHAFDEEALLALNRAGRVEPPSLHRAALPASVDALVLRALARDPAQRFAHTEDLEATLQEACAAHPWTQEDTSALLRATPLPPASASASVATHLPTAAYGDGDTDDAVAANDDSWLASGLAALVRGDRGLAERTTTTPTWRLGRRVRPHLGRALMLLGIGVATAVVVGATDGSARRPDAAPALAAVAASPPPKARQPAPAILDRRTTASAVVESRTTAPAVTDSRAATPAIVVVAARATASVVADTDAPTPWASRLDVPRPRAASRPRSRATASRAPSPATPHVAAAHRVAAPAAPPRAAPAAHAP